MNEEKQQQQMKGKNEWGTKMKWQQNEEQKLMNNNNKNLTGGSPKQSNIAGSFYPPIKKKNWLQKCVWYYLYIWYCSAYGGDFDI